MLLDFVCGSVFLYCAAAIARDDLAFRIVPDRFLLIMFATGALYGFLVPHSPGESPLDIVSRLAFQSAVPSLSALSVAMIYRVFRGRDGLGLGDIKLIAAAGIWVPVLDSFYAVTAASIVALALMTAISLRRGTALALSCSLPFAIFLAPAFWLLWLFEKAGLLPL